MKAGLSSRIKAFMIILSCEQEGDMRGCQEQSLERQSLTARAREAAQPTKAWEQTLTWRLYAP